MTIIIYRQKAWRQLESIWEFAPQRYPYLSLIIRMYPTISRIADIWMGYERILNLDKVGYLFDIIPLYPSISDILSCHILLFYSELSIFIHQYHI